MIKQTKIKTMKLLQTILFIFAFTSCFAQQKPAMYYTDMASGKPIAKDPTVVFFKDAYWMYYSIAANENKGWNIGIAKSGDLIHWEKAGEIDPAADYEKKGLCAPGALVRDRKVHLFYQTYGNGPKDAICHAWSTDGISFERNRTNPIFHPTGDWNNGRAIDAEVVLFKNKYLLYFATRDPEGKIQKQGVAEAPKNTHFDRADWKLAVDRSILEPKLSWEGKCVEGASIVERDGTLYMFYAGSYNNEPQQIGVASSKDGISWKRLSDKPILTNGTEGSWNSSESGHPDIFEDKAGKYHLFYQGNNTNGQSWYLSQKEVGWEGERPVLKD